MSNQEIAQKVKQFLATNFYVADLASLHPQASFFEAGIVDSTGVLEVVNFLEETFGITVRDNEVLPENLDSLRGIIDFVERKLSTPPRLRLLHDEDMPNPTGAAEGTAQTILTRDGNEPV